LSPDIAIEGSCVADNPVAVTRSEDGRLAHVVLDTGAAANALSIGFLSEIERGLSSPSLKALASLADALGLPIAGLFEARTPSDEAGLIAAQPMLDLSRSPR